MTNNQLLQMLAKIEKENYYFHPDNRNWKTLEISTKTPMYNSNITQRYLFELGLCDETGQLHSLFLNTGLFLCFKYENDSSTGEVIEPRMEYLYSPLGLKFLNLLDTQIQDHKRGDTVSFTTLNN